MNGAKVVSYQSIPTRGRDENPLGLLEQALRVVAE